MPSRQQPSAEEVQRIRGKGGARIDSSVPGTQARGVRPSWTTFRLASVGRENDYSLTLLRRPSSEEMLQCRSSWPRPRLQRPDQASWPSPPSRARWGALTGSRCGLNNPQERAEQGDTEKGIQAPCRKRTDVVGWGSSRTCWPSYARPGKTHGASATGRAIGAWYCQADLEQQLDEWDDLGRSVAT